MASDTIMRLDLTANKNGLLLLVVCCGIYLCSSKVVSVAEANNISESTSRELECEARSRRASSEAERALLLLYCNVRPLVDTFKPLRQALAAKTSSSLSSELDEEWDAFGEQVGGFYKESVYLLDRSDFCTYPVIKRLKALCRSVSADCGVNETERRVQNKQKKSNLLHVAFDLLAIEFHERCLMAVLPKLPPVPYLVRDVVKIYITGADKELVVPDLNADASSADDSDDSPAANEHRLILSGLSADKFDVEAAIRSQGPLEQVMLLLISFDGQSDEDRVQKFKDTCKEFVMEIEQRWQSFEMLSTMIASTGNGIRQLNNYVMRSLIPTRYADICSRLSERS